jgi:glycosyltransferase involved in cell wall biosynthesis
MRFTIVTPSYGQLDWLELCIASVADQQGVGFIEHIVQDAGTLGIEEFARRLGAAFYRDGKKVFSAQSPAEGQLSQSYSLMIYSEKDAGMYDAINKGLRRATGETCAYLNCDEQYLPGTLRWVADYLSASPEIEVLFGAAIVTRADGSYVCDRRVMVPTRWHTMVSGNLSIFTSSTFFRRTAVVDQGLLFDPQWRVCGDAVWALRFLEAGLRMTAAHKPLSVFAETGVNMSALSNSRAAEENRRLLLLAPMAARLFKPTVVLAYRVRRWWCGVYNLAPHEYAVYTLAEVAHRKRFEVGQPTFHWQMGSEV